MKQAFFSSIGLLFLAWILAPIAQHVPLLALVFFLLLAAGIVSLFWLVYTYRRELWEIVPFLLSIPLRAWRFIAWALRLLPHNLQQDLDRELALRGLVKVPLYAPVYDLITKSFADFYAAHRTELRYNDYFRTTANILDTFIRNLPQYPDYNSGFTQTLNVDFASYLPALHAAIETAKQYKRPIEQPSYPFEERYWKEQERLHGEQQTSIIRETQQQQTLLGALMLPIIQALPMTIENVSYPIDEELYFAGEFVVGNPGTGKTTYLTRQIIRRFPEVVEDRASILVIDSQNELIPDLAHLRDFAPDGSLADKLVYLEVDPSYPLSLNIFDNHNYQDLSDFDRDVLNRSAHELITFFVRSIIQSDTSGHMNTVLAHVIPAAMSVEDATIDTLQTLVQKGEGKNPTTGYDLLRDKLHVDADEHNWLRTRLYSPDYGPTLGSIRARLDGFTADPLFKAMFKHPRNKLDLADLLQTSRVILINTNKGHLHQATAAFGRFFIAKLLQATQERMLIDREARRPVYAFIDEASDYIAEDANITELLDKGRKQKVSLTIAVQNEERITSRTVLSALTHAAIQTRTVSLGVLDLQVRGQDEPARISFPPFILPQHPELRMSEPQFHHIRREMLTRFGTARPRETPRRAREPEPQEWEYEEEPVEEVRLLPAPDDDIKPS